MVLAICATYCSTQGTSEGNPYTRSLEITPSTRSGEQRAPVRYRPKNDRCWNRRPARICSTRASESDPIRSPRRAFSTEETCETTTTLRLGRFPSPAPRRTLPSSFARRRFDVSAHTTTVATREWLKTSSWTTTWGWGWPGTGPGESSGPIQNTSPRFIRAEGVSAGSPAFVSVCIGAQRYLTSF